MSNGQTPVADGEDGGDLAALPLAGAVEAILFVADKPVSAINLATVLRRPLAEIHAAIVELAQHHASGASAIEVREIGGGWRLYVKAGLDPAVAAYAGEEAAPKLSQAALETLAVVAYKQPVSRGQIAAVRAVNVDSVVRTLVGRGLIAEVDSDPETGAALFATTALFLSAMGLTGIDELPPISPLLPDAAEATIDAG